MQTFLGELFCANSFAQRKRFGLTSSQKGRGQND